MSRSKRHDSCSCTSYAEYNQSGEESGSEYLGKRGYSVGSWSTGGRQINFDVILPNNLLLQVQPSQSRSLSSLKQEVFLRARSLPLNRLLDDPSNYIFTMIGFDNTHVELYDEQKTVSTLNLMLPLLKLIEPDGNKMERELTQNIGIAMGVQLDSNFDKYLNAEYCSFRSKLYELCCQVNKRRGKEGLEHYAFPREPLYTPYRIHNSYDLEIDEICEADIDYVNFSESPDEIQNRAREKLKRKIQFSNTYLETWYIPVVESKKKEISVENCYHVRVFDVLERTPNDLITFSISEIKHKHGLAIRNDSSEFILQIVGKNIFLTDESACLIQFEYIRSCFENHRIPKLVLRLRKDIFKFYSTPPEIFEPTYIRKERHNRYLENDRQAIEAVQKRNFWDLDENFILNVQSASQITVIEGQDKLFLRVAIVAGRHVLDVKDAPMVPVHNPRWKNATLEFAVYCKDLPLSAYLSMTLISTHSSKRTNTTKAEKNNQSQKLNLMPIGWTTFRLFDWQMRLKQGKRILPLRPFLKEQLVNDDEQGDLQFLNLTNIDMNSGTPLSTCTPLIDIELPDYNQGNKTIIEWPSQEIITKFISILNSRRKAIPKDKDALMPLTPENPNLERLLELRRCLDPLRLTIDDQNFLWKMRHKIQHLFPQMLPIIADCGIIWHEREKTCEFYQLLNHWPLLNVETAIELLDSRYFDEKLRRFAVENLNSSLNDDQIQLYLLILIQAIRFEPFAESDLSKMLLTRSLSNYRVGSLFFWLLRSELAQIHHIHTNDRSTRPYSTPLANPLYLRYTLLLEAYCRGNCAHLLSMMKQVEMVNILTTISARIKSISNKETANKMLHKNLLEHKAALQNVTSPLNTIDQLGELIIEECRVMNSAKQPLLLTWKNPTCLSSISILTHQLIFKNGDDMRQDMLTLQVMRIMDAMWKNRNHDYCLTLYEVLPMGRNIGLIHVVQNCKTLFQIQNSDVGGSSLSPMEIALFNKYLQKHSQDSKRYLECVDRFTASLIGYCVATYILGIKDRHQDNIMLATDGRIFHIDFGHFLGHTKRKLGIKRERTDFVLTDHFLFVISRGKQNFRHTFEYMSFRDECTNGFMIIHYYARFFIVLFRMMLCVGLSELSSYKDVEFIRSSLMYDKIEPDDVKESFQQIFEHVVKGDWSVKVDWFFHSVHHANIIRKPFMRNQ